MKKAVASILIFTSLMSANAFAAGAPILSNGSCITNISPAQIVDGKKDKAGEDTKVCTYDFTILDKAGHMKNSQVSLTRGVSLTKMEADAAVWELMITVGATFLANLKETEAKNNKFESDCDNLLKQLSKESCDPGQSFATQSNGSASKMDLSENDQRSQDQMPDNDGTTAAQANASAQ